MTWIGIDVGGTFTDVVAYDAKRGELRTAKSPTTPDAPQRGVFNAIEALSVGLDDVERLVHGLTLATNTVLESKGADVWVITNRGFRDTLEIARTNRPVLFNIKTLKAAPLVPRTRILEIGERTLRDGTVLRGVDEPELAEVIGRLRDASADAVAVCLLHSYANPASEKQVADVVRRELPGCFVTTSSDVLPEFREYERFSTAVLNAYTGPRLSRYLGALDAALGERGYRRPVYIMTSNGGVFTAGRAAKFPVNTILSGPAGGVAAAVAFGEAIGLRNLITYDMGGTSTDVCLLEDLVVPVTNEQFIADLPNRTPQIEINSVGAGGGSIAWVDNGPQLRVGPQSAGAAPGPACYGRGGTEATVTDANLMLRRLRAGARLGGSVFLDEGLADRAIRSLAARLGDMEPYELAEGIIRIAVARMVSAIKEISIARGFDPRDFALLAYGGAGPMHAVLIADELEIRTVVIPPNPGNFSAFGAILSDVRHDYVRTLHMPLNQETLPTLEATFQEMETRGRQAFVAEKIEPRSMWFRRTCGMRYVGQSWELIVELPDGAANVEVIAEAFRKAHAQRYGHATADPIEIVNFRLAVIGEMSKPALPSDPSPAGTGGDVEHREVFIDGKFERMPVYQRPALGAGTHFAGPAVVEEAGSMTLVPRSWLCSVEKHGVLICRREG